ncbi:MAG: NUDIX domain-containing protein [Actinobacteria bacterium]|nr:NUDIX domain-containing protein [Actinomycetota bacterium]
MTEQRTRLSTYAVAIRDEAVLLCQISAGYPNEGMWTLPGGGVDWGEHPEDALVREVYEETGLALGSREFLGVFSRVLDSRVPPGQFHFVGLIYRAPLVGEPHVTEVDGSTCAVRWIPLAELEDTAVTPLVDEGLKLAHPTR